MDEPNMMASAGANVVVSMKRTSMTAISDVPSILPPVQIENWKKYHRVYSSALVIVKDASLEMAGKIYYFRFVYLYKFLPNFAYRCKCPRTVFRNC
jgi:hypothetical protein